VTKHCKHEFMVSNSSFKSSTQSDVRLVNAGPFRVKQTMKQSTLQGVASP